MTEANVVPPEGSPDATTAKEKALFTDQVVVVSENSEKHPEHTEDAHFELPEQGLFAVFDGLGGSEKGTEAAEIARKAVETSGRSITEIVSTEEAEALVDNALNEAHKTVLDSLGGEGQLAGSILLLWKDRETGKMKLTAGNVGDSRIGILRASSGKFEQITLDDSSIFTEKTASEGEDATRKLQERFNNVERLEDLLPGEEQMFRIRNVMTQALGASEEQMEDKLQARIRTIDIEPGDIIALYTDGISDNVTDNEIERITRDSPDLNSAGDQLLKRSKEIAAGESMRAKKDDKTLILTRIAPPAS